MTAAAPGARRKGLYFGLLVGLAWGLDTVLLGRVVDHSPAFAGGFWRLLLCAAFLHEAFGFIWLLAIAAIERDLAATFHLLIRTRKGRASALAAIVGGPVAMSAFVLGIHFASPAYATAVSECFPGIGGLLAFVLLKERISARAALGIALCIAGSVALGYSPVDLSVYPYFTLGVAMSFAAALCWASEGVLIAYAMQHIQTETHLSATPRQFVTIRFFISTLVYACLIVPLLGDHDALAGLSGLELLQFAGIAFLGVATYLAWYQAVSYIGAALGTALNSIAALWAMLFSWLILGTAITGYLALCSAVVVVGVFVFALSRDVSAAGPGPSFQ